MDSKLDHLKKIFRSMLLPEKYGATIEHFRKLYVEMEGEEIPYRRFGFNTDIELLSTMNGVVHMRLDKYGNMKVFAKQSSESQHIVDLVANQRPKYRRTNKGYNQFQTTRSTQRTQSSNTSNGYKTNVGHQTIRNTSNFGSFRTPRALNPSTKHVSWHQQPIANSTKPAEFGSSNQSMASNSIRTTETGTQHQKSLASSDKPSVDSSFKNSNHKPINNMTPFDNQNDQLDGPANDFKNHRNEAVEDKRSNVFDTTDNTKTKNESDNKSEEINGRRKAWYRNDRKPQMLPPHLEHSVVIDDEANKGDIFSVELFPFSEYDIEVNKIAEPKFDLFKLTIGAKLKVCIPQTFSPYKFWFHIEDEIGHLEVLMERLAEFYEVPPTDSISGRKMPKGSIEAGKICAVKYLNEWHRGKILYVDETVKVFFLDYGTVAEVSHEDLRFLAKEFSKLPAFARRGVLDMVKPTFGTWTIEALHFFEKITKFYQYNLICATITNIKEEERTVYFKLTDYTLIPNFDVAENLIRHNCAYSTKKSLANFRSRHLNEIRPNFDMLESGQHPSTEEIFRWHTEKHFDWIAFDDLRFDLDYLGYETIE